MRKFNLTTLSMFFLSFFIGCSENQEFNRLSNDQEFEISRENSEPQLFNHEQLGKFVYHHTKYYATTLDPYQYFPEEYRDEFKNKSEELINMIEDNNWELDEILNYLKEQDYYTENQFNILRNQQRQLEQFLIGSEPDTTEVWNWCLEKEEEIINDETLAFEEKSQLLNERAIVRYLLKYRLERIDEGKKAKQGRYTTTQSVCGFWEQLACWTGAITGLSGITGMASNFVAEAALSTFNMIGAAIGATIGIFNGIQNCQCDNEGVCIPFTGVAFPYECYTGANLSITGWGYGDDTPSQFFWEFYKNGNASSGSNFYSNFTSVDNVVLPGSQISSNNVSSLALFTKNYCDTEWLESEYFGWYHLDDLGKPFFVIDGNSSISSYDADYISSFLYSASGPISISPNTTIQWELIPSGYPGYSATGTIQGGTNGLLITVNWDSTPGFATLKCTATSPCATIVEYFNVHIYDY